MSVMMTAYSYQDPSGGAAGDTTRTGKQVRWGVVAVDPRVIPLGSRLTIEGYGELFHAEDTGFGVLGRHIDVFIPDQEAAIKFGVQYRDIIVLD